MGSKSGPTEDSVRRVKLQLKKWNKRAWLFRRNIRYFSFLLDPSSDKKRWLFSISSPFVGSNDKLSKTYYSSALVPWNEKWQKMEVTTQWEIEKGAEFLLDEKQQLS